MGGLMYSQDPSDFTASSCLTEDTNASRDWISVRVGTWGTSHPLHFVSRMLQLDLILLIPYMEFLGKGVDFAPEEVPAGNVVAVVGDIFVVFCSHVQCNDSLWPLGRQYIRWEDVCVCVCACVIHSL